MNTVQIKNFIAIADIGSVTKAEEILSTTKTALKKQIDTMEQELGFPLFYRTAKGLHLTKAGNLFYERMKPLEEEYRSVVEECKGVYLANKKEIRIGVYTITDMLNWYLDIEHHSNFKIQQVISTGPSHAYNFGMLTDGTVDFLEYEDNEQLYSRGLFYTKIVEDYLCCILSPRHPLVDREAIGPEELKGYQLY